MDIYVCLPLTKIGMCRQISVTMAIINFHETVSCTCRDIPYGQKEGQAGMANIGMTVTFRNTFYFLTKLVTRIFIKI